MMNAAADLLHHLQLENHSIWLKEAIQRTINEDKIHTPGNSAKICILNEVSSDKLAWNYFADLGGEATSMDVIKNVINYLQQKTKVENW